MPSVIRQPSAPYGSFPATRLRRLRRHDWSRALAAETRLHPSDLIWPVFIQDGDNRCTPIASMPGVERLSIDLLVPLAREAQSLGIPALALFPAVDAGLKDEKGSEALNPDNLVCRALRALKREAPGIGLIADVALDPYTSHGLDGIIINGDVANDATVEILCQQAVIQAQSGCDIVAPSDMMDGRIGAIRSALDAAGFTDTLILSYAAKYASALYDPFRDAVDSAKHLQGASKKTFQMDPANAREALREAMLDIEEGADMLMVKPGLPYLDIVSLLARECTLPVLAYQVSGEYAMLRAAAQVSQLDYMRSMLEILLSFKRSGARAILTYAALDVARALQETGF